MKKRIYSGTVLNSTAVVSSVDSSEIDLNQATGFSVLSQITSTTPSAKTFDSGLAQIDRLTVLAKASCGDGDYAVVYDMNGDAWAIAFDATGTSAEPTGAVWTAIPSANKAQVDISGATDAPSVGLIVEAGFSGLVGFSAVITSTDNLDGTIDFERADYGIPTASVDYNADDSGTGTMAWSTTQTGVASEINLTTNIVSVPSHTFATGQEVQLTTTGTLPTGVTTATDYYIISVTSGTIKFASTLAFALAGTAIDLTTEGSGTHTITATALGGAIKLQARLENSTTYVDVASSSVSITGSQNNLWNVVDPMYRYVKVNVTPTGGQLSASVDVLVYGDV